MNLWKEEPSYYGGDVLHQAKKEKIQAAMAENGLDAILLLKAETVRYATDFYVKGYRPFYEPEYLAVIPISGCVPILYDVCISQSLFFYVLDLCPGSVEMCFPITPGVGCTR